MSTLRHVIDSDHRDLLRLQKCTKELSTHYEQLDKQLGSIHRNLSLYAPKLSDVEDNIEAVTSNPPSFLPMPFPPKTRTSSYVACSSIPNPLRTCGSPFLGSQAVSNNAKAGSCRMNQGEQAWEVQVVQAVKTVLPNVCNVSPVQSVAIRVSRGTWTRMMVGWVSWATAGGTELAEESLGKAGSCGMNQGGQAWEAQKAFETVLRNVRNISPVLASPPAALFSRLIDGFCVLLTLYHLKTLWYVLLTGDLLTQLAALRLEDVVNWVKELASQDVQWA
ncbi:hypothetical protein BC835DRAFT_1311400 [Cytidiella melzeri]|nr:hypothetical protein BC835DRAFT_1311400 [Cytidiella melzeri]